MNNEEQVNDHIEEDDNTNNIVEEGSTNTLSMTHSMLEWMMMMMIMKMMNLIMFMIYLFLRRHTDPFMRAPTQIFSLLYC